MIIGVGFICKYGTQARMVSVPHYPNLHFMCFLIVCANQFVIYLVLAIIECDIFLPTTIFSYLYLSFYVIVLMICMSWLLISGRSLAAV